MMRPDLRGAAWDLLGDFALLGAASGVLSMADLLLAGFARSGSILDRPPSDLAEVAGSPVLWHLAGGPGA